MCSASLWQAVAQTPQPMQVSRSKRGAMAFLRSAGRRAGTISTAATGQARAQREQPLHRSDVGARGEAAAVHRPQPPAVGRLELLAAASAAVADEGGAVLDVVGDLDEPLRAGGRQDVHGLRPLHRASEAAAGDEVGAAVERQAHVHGGVAGLAQVLLLVAAVAEGHRPGPGLAHHVGGPLPVEDVGERVVGEGGLVDQRAPDHRVAPQRLAGEGLVPVGVGAERLGHALLGDGVLGPHERVLEEAHHRRREQVGGLPGAGMDQVHHHALVAHGVEPRLELGRRDAQEARDLLERGGAPGQPRRQRRLLGRVEDLQDLLPALPGGRVGGLGERHRAHVEPADQLAVLLLQLPQVTHAGNGYHTSERRRMRVVDQTGPSTGSTPRPPPAAEGGLPWSRSSRGNFHGFLHQLRMGDGARADPEGLCLTCSEYRWQTGRDRPPPDDLAHLHRGETWPRAEDPHVTELIARARF